MGSLGSHGSSKRRPENCLRIITYGVDFCTNSNLIADGLAEGVGDAECRRWPLLASYNTRILFCSAVVPACSGCGPGSGQ
eukprot:scaffold90494_cov38-Cyclotella_meneghiniana.AAC.3